MNYGYDIPLEIPAEVSKQSVASFKMLECWCTNQNQMPMLQMFVDAFKGSLKERIHHATTNDPLFLPYTLRVCGAPALSDVFIFSPESLILCMAPKLSDVPVDVQQRCAVILLTKESKSIRSRTLCFCVGIDDLSTVEDYSEVASRVLVEIELRNLPWGHFQNHFPTENDTPFKRLIIMSESGAGSTLMVRLLYQLALQEKKLNIPTEVSIRTFGEVNEDFWNQSDCFFLFLVHRQLNFKNMVTQYAIPITKDSLNMLVVYREIVPPLTTELFYLHIPRCPSFYDLYVNHIVALAGRIRVRCEMLQKSIPLK